MSRSERAGARSWWSKVLIVTGPLLVSLMLFEVVVRFEVEPSSHSWGRLNGIELPPLRALPLTSARSDRNEPFGDLVVDGRSITGGDLFGLFRPDETVGYVPLEDAVSANGWWQSNGLGARSRVPTTPGRTPGLQRILVFGESFTMGSRVRQEESWPYLLERRSSGHEVVNFAVDGYGMGQAFLRYRQVRDQAEHDLVIVGFVPSEDLIRDVNTLRSLLGWDLSDPMPRFVLEDGELELVSAPYRSAEEARRDGPPGAMSARLEQHLVRYDAAYFPDVFEPTPVVGRLVAYKLVARYLHRRRLRRLRAYLLNPESEAARTTHAIFDTMGREITERGQRFLLVYIPSPYDLAQYRRSTDYQARWKRIAEYCPEGATCIDLMPDMPEAERLDAGYDGTHYGPRTNDRIAELVADALRLAVAGAGP
jgi:hypothetical protein